MLIAYIYDLSDNIKTQLLKISGFSSRELLNDIGSATFNVDPREAWVTYENLKEFTRVRVAVIENNTEQTLFDGVVRKTAGTGKGIRVILNDYLYVLKKKKLYSNKTYTGVAISTILAEILGEINARYASGITLSTSVTAIVDAKYKDFTSYFDIVQDLAKGGYEFSVSGKVLTFATRIGTDHSVDPDLVEFRSDVAIPQEINIVDYEISRDSENFANAVTSLPTDTVPVTVTDASSIAEYGRIEEAYTTDGNWPASADAELANRKQSITEVSITPFANDFSKAEIGDTVKVYIDGGNELQYFNGSLRVTEKNVTYSGSDTSVIYQLSTSKVFTPTLIDEVRKLRDRVKKIEL